LLLYPHVQVPWNVCCKEFCPVQEELDVQLAGIGEVDTGAYVQSPIMLLLLGKHAPDWQR
jgi:hypothetical protein